MKRHVVEHLLWCAVVAGPAAAYAMWMIDRAPDPAVAASIVSFPPEPRRLPRDTLATAAGALVGADPFRFDRTPSPVPYQPELEGAPPPPPQPPKPPKPALVLRGIVGGPPWDAMVEGIPGKHGATLVRHGDTLGGLTISAIKRDTVIIHGADTTWRLTIRRDW